MLTARRLTLAAIAAVITALSTSAGAAAAGPFTFGTVGDHGSNANSAAVIRAVGSANPAFFLSLGDMSYDTITPAAWCQFVKDNLNAGAGRPAGDPFGELYPFQILNGNHDAAGFETYRSCLPDRIGSTVGPGSTYGREYFFDYPTDVPLARLIVTSPGQDYTYTPGSTHYTWLSDTIDQARAAGIRWVIAVNHKNYISSGRLGNEIGSDFFNLLVAKNVDLILQGHDHSYQRSKQLALGAACPAVTAGTADLDCIADDGGDGEYVKGAGPVLLINGLGGHSIHDVSGADTETAYFATIRGSSTSPSYGYSRISVSETALTAGFVTAAGTPITDPFTITSAPARTLTVTPTDDTTVKSGAPTSTFGSTTSVKADSSPVEHGLLKFVVSGTAGSTVTGARLRLFNVNSSPLGVRLHRITGTNTWTEASATWNTAPEYEATPFATMPTVPVNTWVDVDVGSLVRGDGTYGIRLTHGSSDGVEYATKETANRPQLILTLGAGGGGDTTAPSAPGSLRATAASSSRVDLSWSTASDDVGVAGYRVSRNGAAVADVTLLSYADTGVAAGTTYTYAVRAYDAAGNVGPASEAVVTTPAASTTPLTFSPTADTVVKQATPTTNFGTATTFKVDGSPVEHALLKFTVSGIDGRAVRSARLRMFATDPSPRGGDVRRTASTSWSETGVTWNTAPVADATTIAAIGAVSGGTWVDADLTSLVRADGVYSVRISSPNGDGVAYSSREAASNRPQLVVTF